MGKCTLAILKVNMALEVLKDKLAKSDITANKEMTALMHSAQVMVCKAKAIDQTEEGKEVDRSVLFTLKLAMADLLVVEDVYQIFVYRQGADNQIRELFSTMERYGRFVHLRGDTRARTWTQWCRVVNTIIIDAEMKVRAFNDLQVLAQVVQNLTRLKEKVDASFKSYCQAPAK